MVALYFWFTFWKSLLNTRLKGEFLLPLIVIFIFVTLRKHLRKYFQEVMIFSFTAKNAVGLSKKGRTCLLLMYFRKFLTNYYRKCENSRNILTYNLSFKKWKWVNCTKKELILGLNFCGWDTWSLKHPDSVGKYWH